MVSAGRAYHSMQRASDLSLACLLACRAFGDREARSLPPAPKRYASVSVCVRFVVCSSQVTALAPRERPLAASGVVLSLCFALLGLSLSLSLTLFFFHTDKGQAELTPARALSLSLSLFFFGLCLWAIRSRCAFVCGCFCCCGHGAMTLSVPDMHARLTRVFCHRCTRSRLLMSTPASPDLFFPSSSTRSTQCSPDVEEISLL